MKISFWCALDKSLCNFVDNLWKLSSNFTEQEKNYRGKISRSKHIIQQLSLNWQHTRENLYTQP